MHIQDVSKLMRNILKSYFSVKINGGLLYNFLFKTPSPPSKSPLIRGGGLFLFNISTMEEFRRMKIGQKLVLIKWQFLSIRTIQIFVIMTSFDPSLLDLFLTNNNQSLVPIW